MRAFIVHIFIVVSKTRKRNYFFNLIFLIILFFCRGQGEYLNFFAPHLVVLKILWRGNFGHDQDQQLFWVGCRF